MSSKFLLLSILKFNLLIKREPVRINNRGQYYAFWKEKTKKFSRIHAQIKDCRRTLAVFSVSESRLMKAGLPTYGNQFAKEVRMNRQQQAGQKARRPAQTAAQQVSGVKKTLADAGEGK